MDEKQKFLLFSNKNILRIGQVLAKRFQQYTQSTSSSNLFRKSTPSFQTYFTEEIHQGKSKT